jgi:endonuclease-8
MPEGPSIVLLKEAVKPFEGKKIISVYGDTKIGKERLLNKKVLEFKTWGKHFLICFKGFTVRIHLLMFGSYSINERKLSKIDEGKERPVRLGLEFTKGEINFYSCAVKLIEGDINEVYDWSADVMKDKWDAKEAKKKLKEIPGTLITDALLDQNIFAGVGNIIKNEVLYRVKVHPQSKVGDIPARKISEIIKEARNYSFQFLEWKRKFELKKHWLAHTKKTCLRCNLPIIKKYLGKTKRRTFYCDNCQVLYK